MLKLYHLSMLPTPYDLVLLERAALVDLGRIIIYMALQPTRFIRYTSYLAQP